MKYSIFNILEKVYDEFIELYGEAPQFYHSGGVVKKQSRLAANEVPAILQTGEEVYTKKDREAVLSGIQEILGKFEEKSPTTSQPVTIELVLPSGEQLAKAVVPYMESSTAQYQRGEFG